MQTSPERKVWIETFGCQMNINDTEKMYRLLSNLRFTATTNPEQADLILLNTCTIREKAEQKVFSSLGRLREHKIARPGVMIGVAGCMAQMMGGEIRKRAPYVDLIFGTYAIHKLPEMIQDLDEQRRRNPLFEPNLMVTGKLLPDDFDFLPLQTSAPLSPGRQADDVVKHVTIQNGCNKNCSYCIVPTVRGRELSRSSADIVAEVQQLAERGVKEIILVGQTVNSYGKGSATDFADLLTIINDTPGIERIRFTTSHPRDFHDKLLRAMRDCKKVCEHLHLPVQSGSNAVLKRMYRGYTREQYLEKIAALRSAIPNICITTDVIVAFPGETDDDFAATMSLMEEVQFANAFSFIYSPRPFTKAATWQDQIDPAIASDRLRRLIDVQNQRTQGILKRYLGSEVEVLVEGYAPTESGDTQRQLRGMKGRSRDNWNVFFEAATALPGELIKVRIDRVLAHSLQGVVV